MGAGVWSPADGWLMEPGFLKFEKPAPANSIGENSGSEPQLIPMDFVGTHLLADTLGGMTASRLSEAIAT